MNIKFHTIIRSIAGVSGMAVIEAILDGERKAEKFLPLLDRRIKADKEEIIKSLEGNWDPTHLFLLQIHLEGYKQCQKVIEKIDEEIERNLILLEAKMNAGETKTSQDSLIDQSKKHNKNNPKIKVDQYLKNIHGVNVLAIFGKKQNPAARSRE